MLCSNSCSLISFLFDVVSLSSVFCALKVGEVAVVSFGKTVSLLHPFDQPFSDEAGPFVLSRFSFQQKETCWPSLIQSIIRIFDHARFSNTGGGSEENLQLVGDEE